MKLNDFIAQKPECLRLGQHFVNSFCKPVNLHWQRELDILFNLDGEKAQKEIEKLMRMWQWDELPAEKLLQKDRE